MTRISAALPRIGLFLLALIPVLIGAGVLTSMAEGSLGTFTEPHDLVRRGNYPWAMIGHILGGSAMLMLGLAQMSPRLRAAVPGLHRWTGRLLVLAGGWFALSGLWMNASPTAQADSWLYNAAQNVVAVLFVGVLTLGIVAARQRRFSAHRAWMIRAYAISLGAATQTIMILPVFLLYGRPEGLIVDLAFISGWVVNLGLAEVLIRRGQVPARWNGSAMTAAKRS